MSTPSGHDPQPPTEPAGGGYGVVPSGSYGIDPSQQPPAQPQPPATPPQYQPAAAPHQPAAPSAQPYQPAGPAAQPPAPQPQYASGYAAAPPPGQTPTGTYAPPGAGYGQPPDGPGEQPPRTGPNPGATIGWIGFGLAFVVGFIGIVLGAMSVTRSRRAGASIRIGVVAIVVGVLQVLTVIVVVLANLIVQLGGGPTRVNPGDVSQEQTVPVVDLVPGMCLDTTSITDADILVVPCAQPHDGEVIAQLTRTGTAYPGDDTLYDDAIDECYGPVSSALPPTANTQNLYVDAFVPTQEEWDAGSRMLSCLLVSDGTMTGSATAGDLVAPIG
ncbi:MAG: septum formation family protein [Salana multivorans]|uniref:septum formation family protein n=1 Tax=Salana multivorans TaxID=120377 RepID=UPI0009670375|nr:septum formation family protein [Salana multivorans]MBN8880994.1 septum formation family protein [Salana multivorans]OJX96085.1 MAG: hypothetical protein BGO96_07320 [Micrococcales bacterium 73-15]